MPVALIVGWLSGTVWHAPETAVVVETEPVEPQEIRPPPFKPFPRNLREFAAMPVSVAADGGSGGHDYLQMRRSVLAHGVEALPEVAYHVIEGPMTRQDMLHSLLANRTDG